jgi:signal transduction histidine kinase
MAARSIDSQRGFDVREWRRGSRAEAQYRADDFNANVMRVGLSGGTLSASPSSAPGSPLRSTAGRSRRRWYVESEMWEKIVLNLLSNAFKFTLEGQIAVRLGTEGSHAVLEVADTGSGTPQSELPRVFVRARAL